MAKILVVDDDKFILTLVVAVLSRAGHIVTTADEAHGAIEKLENERFDLVLSDANMPGGVSGFDLAATIRKRDDCRDTVVILLTGRSEKHDVERALKSGVDGYLLKPVKPDLLLEKVEALLQKKPLHTTTSETPISFAASVSMPASIVSVSEVGLTFTLSIALPAGFKLRIESETFEKIRIHAPLVKVSTCTPINGKSNAFRVVGKFEILNSGEFQLLRAWLDGNAHLKTKKVS
jgi:CheY-like chemotaxis protein